MVNWPVKSRCGTIPLLHMATVHPGTQFVVAGTVDYDPSISVDELYRQMEQRGDFGLPRSMRKHARLWSAPEYSDAIMRGLPGILAPEGIATGGQFRPPGLAAAISALSAADVRRGKVRIVELSFANGLTNDDRGRLACAAQETLRMMRELYAEGIEAIQNDFPSRSAQEVLILHILRESFDAFLPDRRGQLMAAQGVPGPFQNKAEPRKTLPLPPSASSRAARPFRRTSACGPMPMPRRWISRALEYPPTTLSSRLSTGGSGRSA